MMDDADRIVLFANNKHAIEVANFVVNLSAPIDHADIRRFDERREGLADIFPAIHAPEPFKIVIDAQQIDPPAPSRQLTYFSSNGKPRWVGEFGGNQVAVSCREYTKWEEIWPDADARVGRLMDCVDPYRPVASVDYSVTDTFYTAQERDLVLTAKRIFRGNDCIPEREHPTDRWHLLHDLQGRGEPCKGWRHGGR